MSYCQYCKRTFGNKRAYTQHFNAKDSYCKLARDSNATFDATSFIASLEDDVSKVAKKQILHADKSVVAVSKKLAAAQLGALKTYYVENEASSVTKELSQEEKDALKRKRETDFMQDITGITDRIHPKDSAVDDDDMNAAMFIDNVGSYSSEDEGEVDPPTVDEDGYNISIRQSFHVYAEFSKNNRIPFDKDEITCIKLQNLLIKKKAPLDSYKAIIEWRNASVEKQSEKAKVISRKVLIDKLLDRYNMKRSLPKTMRVHLPHSKAEIKVVYHEFVHQVESLLTDPRFNDNDYNFFNDNPFAPPPNQWDTVSDVNTGLCYRETYTKLIKKPQQEVLLPIIFYMDAAVTGQFENLPITALKFSLGIFTTNTRNKEYAWRTLGYLTNFLPEESWGKTMFKESEHMDVDQFISESEEDSSPSTASYAGNDFESASSSSEEEEIFAGGVVGDWSAIKNKVANAVSAQDFHCQLKALLGSYKKVQDQGGFKWSLRYKGKIHDVTFIPFVPFIKGDTEEHDKHCGHYLSRTQKVSQLCRYCTCPNKYTDSPLANYPFKTPEMIQKLVDLNTEVADKKLRNLSQQKMQNAWYQIKFGEHNKRGVHGSCPSEMLHAVYLGVYKYCRDCLFEQLGKTSQHAKQFNSLAKQYGHLFKRQSYRDMPRTSFSRGIQKGKLMAKEYVGVLLVMLVCLHSTKGQEILQKRKGIFKEMGVTQDWILLVETLLEWGVWLQEPQMDVSLVKRCERKHRYIMYLFFIVARRSKGMGLKLMKFHAITHLADDIRSFGVPEVVNTSSNESHHKPTKAAAKVTQRQMKTFECQTAVRLHEFLALQFALLEVLGYPLPWEYLDIHKERTPFMENETSTTTSSTSRPVTDTGGTVFSLWWDELMSEFQYGLKNSRLKDADKIMWSKDLIYFLGNTVLKNLPELDSLTILTEHKRNDIMFRATPLYRGKPWRDWVMVNWGADGIIPAQLWCFLDFTDLEHKPNFVANGVRVNKQLIYAVVESAPIEETPQEQDQPKKKKTKKKKGEKEKEILTSCLLIPLRKEVISLDPLTRKFYLVPVDSFVEPAVVVPDFGGLPNSFFRILPKSEWVSLFEAFLKQPHEDIPVEEDEVEE